MCHLALLTTTIIRRALISSLACLTCLASEPPYAGTIYIAPDIITSDDPTAFRSLKATGSGMRTMYDRRKGWIKISPHLFSARFGIAKNSSLETIIEIQVNPEFTADEARKEATYYAEIIGKIPNTLREDVETVWIHKGKHSYGGGNNNILIHTGLSPEFARKGILEETFMHEATHTSLDQEHKKHAKWIKAQQSDPGFISTYAKKHPQREDLAESYLLFFALKYKNDRLSPVLRETIKKTMPNRLNYMETIPLDLYPVVPNK